MTEQINFEDKKHVFQRDFQSSCWELLGAFKVMKNAKQIKLSLGFLLFIFLLSRPHDFSLQAFSPIWCGINSWPKTNIGKILERLRSGRTIDIVFRTSGNACLLTLT